MRSLVFWNNQREKEITKVMVRRSKLCYVSYLSYLFKVYFTIASTGVYLKSVFVFWLLSRENSNSNFLHILTNWRISMQIYVWQGRVWQRKRNFTRNYFQIIRLSVMKDESRVNKRPPNDLRWMQRDLNNYISLK